MIVQTRPDSTLAGFPLSIASRWIASGLFVLTRIVRVPLASQTLNHWDSVNHALALTGFDLTANRRRLPDIFCVGGMKITNDNIEERASE